MTTAPEYRFKFEIEDQTTGDVVGADFCQITDIDEFGGCESVDMHVAALLRCFKRVARAEYEANNYPNNDAQRVTQMAAKIRAAVEG